MKSVNKYLKRDIAHRNRDTHTIEDEYKDIDELDEEFRAYINDNQEIEKDPPPTDVYVGGGKSDIPQYVLNSNEFKDAVNKAMKAYTIVQLRNLPSLKDMQDVYDKSTLCKEYVFSGFP